LKTVVKGFVDPDKEPDGETVFTADEQIAKELFELCRGDSHLVFTNSRKRTEYFSSMLTEMCENQHVPNEFFPHHGSLSRELRETLESRLQDVHLPTTAICTMTLELGIDVGKVNSVVQVSAPHSVSSLRQRMGRSGRRGGPSILRGMIAESELTAISDPIDRLRIELVQTLAMFRLLIGHKWYEPADTNLYHFSTLLHQILAVTAQWGGTRADQLYHLLCMTGPFQQVSVEQFKALLVHLGAVDLLTQLSTGELVLGVKGEKLVSHYTFYSVFTTPEEFRILVNNKVLGTLPMDSPVIPGLHIIFGGRYWKVLNIDIESKTIHVEKTKGGNPPKFGGSSVSVHPRVRKEMLQMYRERDYRIAVGENRVEFIDETAKNLFEEAIQFFRESGIADHPILQYGKQTYIFTWQGDKVVNTLVAMLIAYGLDAGHYGGIIEINNCPVSIAMGILGMLKDNGIPSEAEIASTVPEKAVGKYDELLPENILCDGYGNATFDSQGAMTWLNVHI
jgi:ATP-dependent Lhr-like helicase